LNNRGSFTGHEGFKRHVDIVIEID
jgi:hypothetical protein